MLRIFICTVFVLFLTPLSASDDIKEPSDSITYLTGKDNERRKFDEPLTFEQQSGLPVAASKIYFSDSKFAFSGFGESNFIYYDGPKNRESQDIELYNTQLQRFVAYAAYKPVNWLVIYAEIFAEFANDGLREGHFEYLPEFFLDFLIHEKFNLRVGTHQPSIGYINNNDEPILFYSVNRPEVERLIIPSQWIDLGVMAYGNITKDLKWTLAAYQGLDAANLNGASWIRRGREDVLRFNFNSAVFNSKFMYTGLKDTEISVSGVWSKLVDSYQENGSSSNTNISSNMLLLSSYIRHEYKNWTFMALGSYGSMSNTDQLYQLTASSDIGSQILGERVYGFYTEVSYDIWPLFKASKKTTTDSDNVVFRKNEFKLPFFARMERLNTHAQISEALEAKDEYIPQSDLTALTLGINFNPRKNIVLKSNYQFRWNKAPLPGGIYEGNRFEIGMGFIF